MKLFKNQRIKKVFFYALIIKSILFVYFSVVHNQITPDHKIKNFFFVGTKDVTSYIVPIENLVDKGTYEYTMVKGGETITIPDGRMPGLVPVYGPLYFIFGRDIALTLFAFLNLLMDVITVCLVAEIAFLLFNSIAISSIAFLLYSISGFISMHNNYMLTETISTFTSILSLYFLVNAIHQKGNEMQWVGAGIFIAWSTFLRPAFGVIFGVYGIIFLVTRQNIKALFYKSNIHKGAMLAFPLLLALALWTGRNYQLTQKIIPLSNTWEYWANDETKAICTLIMSWSGDIVAGPYSERAWFCKPTEQKGHDQEFIGSNPFPNSIYTKDYNIDSLRTLRKLYWGESVEGYSSAGENNKAHILAMTKRFDSSFRENVSIIDKFIIRLDLLGRFIFIKQVYQSAFDRTNLFCRTNKAFFLLIHYIQLIFGMLGILMIVKKGLKLPILIAVIPIVFVLVHVFVVTMIERRYLFSIIPIMSIYAAYTLGYISNRYFPSSTEKLIKLFS
jgi:hypothetical protein